MEVLNAIEFRETITLGSAIVGLLLLLSSVVGIVYGVRYKSAYEAEHATAVAWRNGLEAERDKAVRLEETMGVLGSDLLEARSKLATTPDLTAVMQELNSHEDRAQERHDAQIAVLAGMAASLEKIARKGGM